MVKNLSSNAGDLRDTVFILGQEDRLEQGMSIHFGILAWGIPWTEETGAL